MRGERQEQRELQQLGADTRSNIDRFMAVFKVPGVNYNTSKDGSNPVAVDKTGRWFRDHPMYLERKGKRGVSATN
jgi:hypothetical protein